MAMVVKNNLSAVRTLNILNSNSAALQKGMARVSSGMKITGAQDDAAGFAISERMRVRIRALDQANQNSQNDSSLMKTAEGAVGNTIDILKALKEKCINAANDSNTDEDRQTIQKEIDQYIDQIDDNALVTFNGKTLVDGTKNNAATATKTILLNQSLKAGTLAQDALTSLANRAGDSLGIQSTDYYQVSWVENGKIHSTSGQVGTNSIKDILSTPDVNGDKLEATVAATSKEGLIGTTEPESADMPKGYVSAGITIPTDSTDVTGVAIADIAALFPTEGSAITELGTLTGYAIAETDADGNVTAKDVTISVTQNADDSTKFDLSIADSDGNNLDLSQGVELIKKDVPAVTYQDSDAQPVDDKDGYINAPTDASLKIDADSYNKNASVGTDALITSLEALTGLSFGSGVTGNLGDCGIYTKSEDGTYTKVDIEYGWDSTNAKVTFTFNDESQGKDLYKLDTAQSAITDAKTTFTGTSATTDFPPDNPDEITTYTEPDPLKKEKDVPDKYNKDVYTPDKTYGVAVVAKTAGVDNQISGLTISILDQDLNVKKSANAALDQFKQYQRAENQTGDQALNFQLGSEANQAIKVGFSDMRAQALGLKGADGTRINVYTKENANASINVIENALTKALDQQTTIGAVESRLEYTSANLTTASENVQASESTIRDADMAKEMTNYTKANVLLQAAQAMLAQANQSSSSVLSLLQ